MPNEATTIQDAEAVPDRSRAAALRITRPTPEDASAVHDLIAACPPLDGNSLYANLIQCSHFAATCAVARLDGRIVGWVSGHTPPGRDDTYFLWQVAIHPDMRGTGLGRRLLADILNRPETARARFLETSITKSNDASWGLFRSIAGWLKAPMRDAPWFDRDQHFAGRHDTEFLVTIGPFAAPPPPG